MSNPDYLSERVKRLKKLKLVSGLSRELTKTEKAKVNRLWAKWHEIADNPKEFKRLSVAKFDKANVDALKKTGYLVHEGYAYIPLHGYHNASLARDTYRTEKGPYDRIIINRTMRDSDGQLRKRQSEYVGSHTQKLDWRDRLLEQYRTGKFKDGELLALKVYENGTMVNSSKLTIDEILKYAEQIKWETAKDADKLRNNLHLVKSWVKGQDESTITKSTKQKQKEYRARTKRRNQTRAKKPTNKRGK